MKKRNLSLVSFILLAVYMVMSFMPIIFEKIYWKAETAGVGVYKRGGTDEVNIFAANNGLVVLMLLFAAVGIFALIMQFIGKDSKVFNIMTFAPCVSFLFFVISVIARICSRDAVGGIGGTATSGYYGYYDYGVCWGLFIEIALILAVSIMSVIIAIGKVKNAYTINNGNCRNHAIDAADEIKKYKELLDEGAITQEEYDEKKKKLLNI